MVEQLEYVRDTACEFLKAGDAEGTLVVLTTLLTEVSGSYPEFDDSDGELGGFLDELALPMVEAILSADLSKSERNSLAKELEPVIDELTDYGIDYLDVILIALEHGWSVDTPANLEDIDFEEAILIEASRKDNYPAVVVRSGALSEQDLLGSGTPGSACSLSRKQLRPSAELFAQPGPRFDPAVNCGAG